MSCPDDQTLKLFIAGRLAPQQVEEIEKHLETCPLCSERLSALEIGASIPIFQDIRAAHLSGSEWGSESESTDEDAEISAAMPQTIGHYSVRNILGTGGMGTVYLGENPYIDRKVAIKVVKPNRRIHQSVTDRFAREMKAVGNLQHPNIVQAIDGGVVDEQPYLVMEYLEGCDLSQYVKEQGPLPVKKACDIIRQVAAALEYAHQMGYVHRDIKPSNIWITADGTVKVLDFGLVSVLEREANKISANRTPAGLILGSPDYISPEQIIDSTNVDHRSDIYSLGCTFYYLLTGRSPFDKTTHPRVGDKLDAHVTEPVPPLNPCRKDVPKAVEQLLQKMVAKQPIHRPQSAAAVGYALKKQGIRRRFFGGVAALVAVIMISAVLYTLTRRDDHTESSGQLSVVSGQRDDHTESSGQLSVASGQRDDHTKFPAIQTGATPAIADSIIAPERIIPLSVVRMTLALDADNKGHFRVEKGLTSDPPDDSFQGEPFTHSVFPHAVTLRGEGGMGRMIWGFGDPMEAWKNYGRPLAHLQSIAEIKNGALWTYFGGGGLCIANARFPIRFCCDFPDIHDGELQMHIGGGTDSQYGRFLLIVKCNADDSYEISVWLETLGVSYGPEDAEAQTPGTLKKWERCNLEQPVERTFQIDHKLRNPDIVLKRMAGHVAPITRVDVTARFIAAPEFMLKEAP